MKPAMEWQIIVFDIKNGFLDPKLVQFDVKNVKIGQELPKLDHCKYK